nr:retrovirus-related Pol polyprotein from transposon TNT 1-94 [Tanacetum cinerariifolium]
HYSHSFLGGFAEKKEKKNNTVRSGGYRANPSRCLETKNTIFSRDVTFNESAMLKKEVQAKEPRQQQHESIATSKPKRNTKRPARLNDTVACASSIPADDVPTTYSEAVRDSKNEKWRIAMSEEMSSLQKNQTWELEAKGYAQKEGIDYNEVFSPVVKHSSIRILLALVAQLDLELVQMDVKTAFLHGDLEEKIYMVRPEGFKVAGKAHKMQYLRRVLKRFRFDKKTKRVSTPLASQFKISAAMSSKNDAERPYMEKVPYENAVGSLMYAMICTRLNISHVVGMSTNALSTMEAKYMAMMKAVKEAIWLQGLLGELRINQKFITMYSDSHSAIHLANNQVYHARTNIDVRYHYIQEILEEGGVRIQKIHTSKTRRYAD